MVPRVRIRCEVTSEKASIANRQRIDDVRVKSKEAINALLEKCRLDSQESDAENTENGEP